MLRILQKEERKTVGRRAPAGKCGNIPSFPCGKSFDIVEKGYSRVTHIYVRTAFEECKLSVSPEMHRPRFAFSGCSFECKMQNAECRMKN